MKTATIHITPINVIGDALARALAIVKIRHTTTHGTQGPSGTVYATAKEAYATIQKTRVELEDKGFWNVQLDSHDMTESELIHLGFSVENLPA